MKTKILALLIFFIFVISNVKGQTTPGITSCSYTASTHVLVVNGSNLSNYGFISFYSLASGKLISTLSITSKKVSSLSLTVTNAATQNALSTNTCAAFALLSNSSVPATMPSGNGNSILKIPPIKVGNAGVTLLSTGAGNH
jgi:hypothetical protein